ncbi:Short-chain dehydrogenase/reductase ascJ [Apiospora arundinis]
MSLVQINKEAFSNLESKVIVITGGTTGIGAAAVTKLAVDLGAKVVFGDIKAPENPPDSSHVTFVRTDVTSYASVLNLFKQAWQLHGRVDYAIPNAGLAEVGKLFATGDDDAAIEEAPPTMVLDVNLKGTIFFMRVAVHFLRKSLARHRDSGGGGNDKPQKDACLLLVSSIASLGEFPGLFQYCATKQGVMGLFRSTKDHLLETEGIRVNAVLPNSTRTTMVAGIIGLYNAMGLATNEPEDVADTFLHALASDINGEALYVTGGKTYEVEKALTRVKGDWLGQAVYDELLACQQVLGSGDKWTDRKGGNLDDYENGALKA